MEVVLYLALLLPAALLFLLGRRRKRQLRAAIPPAKHTQLPMVEPEPVQLVSKRTSQTVSEPGNAAGPTPSRQATVHPSLYYDGTTRPTAERPPRQLDLSNQAAAGPSVISGAAWLTGRWEWAEKERSAGELKNFPYWYFDPATDRQLEKLQVDGINVPLGLTKGQASDFIGLKNPPDERDAEILRFFKVPLKGMSQTQARHEVAQIKADAEKMRRWQRRPPSQMQREFFRFMGLPIPKGASREETEKLIKAFKKVESKSRADDIEEWDNFTFVVYELDDPGVRAAYSVRKVPLAIIKAAFSRLDAQSRTSGDISDHFEDLIENIIALKPELETN